MADKSKQTIIIKKVQGGGHGAPHGGAWKVAFADFMTAMMTFFLVMWLLGSDEEIQSSVAQYFNNPASAWRPDLASKETMPLGEKTGAGEQLLKGLNGQMPEEMIDKPSREYRTNLDITKPEDDPSPETHPEGIKAPARIDIHILQFSIPEYQLFKDGKEELGEGADQALKQVVRLVTGYKGKLTVEGFTTPYVASQTSGDAKKTDPYEFANSRVVAIKNYFTHKRLIDDDRVRTKVSEALPEDYSSTTGDSVRKLVFTFKH